MSSSRTLKGQIPDREDTVKFKILLHNLWGLVQNENVGPLIENYLEFQDGLSRALLSVGPSVTSQVACLWPVLVGRGSKTKVII